MEILVYPAAFPIDLFLMAGTNEPDHLDLDSLPPLPLWTRVRLLDPDGLTDADVTGRAVVFGFRFLAAFTGWDWDDIVERAGWFASRLVASRSSVPVPWIDLYPLPVLDATARFVAVPKAA